MKANLSLFTILFLFVASCAIKENQEQQSNKKPNIIFLFADDQCYQTVHAQGNSEIITPTLDKLASEGAVFTHAYNMGAWNGAVCLASRAMLNTGRYVWRAYSYVGHQQDIADT